MKLDLRANEDIRDLVHRTVQALVEGHVVGFPTETVYVLAVHSLNEAAVEKLMRLRDTPPEALVLSLRSRDACEDFLHGGSPIALRLAQRCWPGPLTIRTACRQRHSAVSHLPGTVIGRIMDRHGEIGFRVVDHRVVSQVHRYLAAPLLMAPGWRERPPAAAGGTDASPQPLTTAAALASQWGDSLSLLLDDGPTRYGGESTVVRVVADHWELLHEGVMERAAMTDFVKPTIAVVCTGNTCRSPMAAAILREKLAQRFGDPDAAVVVSAGVAAGNGSPASIQAVEVMRSRGLDISDHASRMLDDTIVSSADLILTLTRGHRAAILAAWPELCDRVFTLRADGGDVNDPVGMPVEAYAQCADQIDRELASWVERLGDDFLPQQTLPEG